MQQGMDKLWGSEYKIVLTIIKNNSIVIILSTRKVIAHRMRLYEEFFSTYRRIIIIGYIEVICCHDIHIVGLYNNMWV